MKRIPLFFSLLLLIVLPSLVTMFAPPAPPGSVALVVVLALILAVIATLVSLPQRRSVPSNHPPRVVRRSTAAVSSVMSAWKLVQRSDIGYRRPVVLAT